MAEQWSPFGCSLRRLESKVAYTFIPAEFYELLVAEREAPFQVLDRLHSKLPQIPEEEG